MENLERALGKGLSEALREERAENLARRIILAHKEGNLTLEDIENITLLLRERKEEDPIAHATKELLTRYLVHYLRSQRFSPKEAKLSHLIREALERGEDPIEWALRKVSAEEIIGSFLGVRTIRQRRRIIDTNRVLGVLLRKLLKNLEYIKDKTDVRASDLIHLYHFLVSHGFPMVEVKVVGRGANREVYTETVPMKLDEYLKYFSHYRTTPYKLFYPLNLLLSIRDAYKETGERIVRVSTSSGSPDFVRLKRKLYPISTEFYNIVVEQLGIPLDYILKAHLNATLSFLNQNLETIRRKIQALENLGISLDYILRAHPSDALRLLNSNPRTIQRKIQALEEKEGRSIKELVKAYSPNTLLVKILTTHPP